MKKTGFMMKIVAIAAAAAIMIGMLSGCGSSGKNNGRNSDGKIVVEVGNWPHETDEATLNLWTQYEQDFESAHPDIDIVPNTYVYDVKTFATKSAAGQLPDIYRVPFSEAQSIIRRGCAADITDKMKEAGLLDSLNKDLIDMTSDENGRIYSLPQTAYAQGVMINKDLFKQAGLVNDDGTVKVPKTFEELAEYAAQIKEKTGVAGFAMPTTNNVGGWILLNVAWNYGVEFEKMNDDGKWTATFDTPEFHDTLQWLYDLRWNKGALADNTVIDGSAYTETFGTGQAAMILRATTDCNTMVTRYGMNKDVIAMGEMPEGPKAHYSQLGGQLYALKSTLTDEQIDAAFEWLKFMNVTPELDEQKETELRKLDFDQGRIVWPYDLFSIWDDDARTENVKKVREPFVNIDMKDYQNYADAEGITLRAEPEVCAQELYSVLDGVIQEVLTNKDVDIPAISKKAQDDFQVNHLDKMD